MAGRNPLAPPKIGGYYGGDGTMIMVGMLVLLLVWRCVGLLVVFVGLVGPRTLTWF